MSGLDCSRLCHLCSAYTANLADHRVSQASYRAQYHCVVLVNTVLVLDQGEG